MLLRPAVEYSLADLARRTGAVPSAVHREVQRLITSGLFLDRRVGKTRLVRANTEDRLFEPTKNLLEVTYGPQPLLEQGLRTVAGVDRAFIFGSWAARRHGIPGPPPNDIDVLVVGSASRRDLEKLGRELSTRLNIEVAVERITGRQWDDETDPFVQTVRQRHLVELDLQRMAGHEALGAGVDDD